MIKVTVLYNRPENVDTFEKYYKEKHMHLVHQLKELSKIECTVFTNNPDGSTPAYYRMAELYFESAAIMQQAFTSNEGRAVTGDVPNFATGGVTIIFGTVE